MNAPFFRTLLLPYCAVLAALLVVDGIWLGLVMGPHYREWLGGQMLETPRVAPAAVFYLLYSAGLMLFAVRPAQAGRNWRQAAGLGAMLGMVAYGTYDLTNLATLTVWPLALTAADMAWGTVLSSVAAVAGLAGSRRQV